MKMLRDALFWMLLFLGFFAYWLGYRAASVDAQSATVTQTYGLTLERDDFPPATAGQTTFQTAVSTRSSFALVFRNGLLQRPCPAGAGGACDYAQTGNVIVTYAPNVIQPGDLVTLLFYR